MRINFNMYMHGPTNWGGDKAAPAPALYSVHRVTHVGLHVLK